MKNYFVYQHIRLDTNEIFYIGIGTKNQEGKTFRQIYKRAYSKERNIFWKRIVNKTKYKIEILDEFDDVTKCLKKETELIDLYGRLIEGTGKLTNIVRDNSEIEKKRIENLLISIEKRKKKTYKYSKEGLFLKEYSSLGEAAFKNNTLPTDIMNCITGRNYLTVGFQWKYEKFDKIPDYKELKRIRKETNLIIEPRAIDQYSLRGEFIRTWESAKEAAEYLKVAKSAIRNVLCGISDSCCNFLWVYKGKSVKIPNYRVEIYNLDGLFLNKYFTFRLAEIDLNLPKNTISVYLQRREKHSKYIFKDLKEKNENK